uniref:Polysaccharide pyruvyl transferase family protein n=1 Tax=Erysipelothrix tonsillarum TaxID=38402 RepID=A0A6S6I5E0_9FIRM|nr:polysaccharide pyruvyl transferase family protein [Erysipelothrix tonsillarum]
MNILLIASGGNDNFGDESMMNYIIDKYRESGDDVTVGYFNKKKEVFERRYKYPYIEIKAITNRVPLSLHISKIMYRKYAKDFDKLVICGGGNISTIYPNYVKNILAIASVFEFKKKKVELRPQSIGPFNGKFERKNISQLKKLITISDVFLIRDEASYDLVDSLFDNSVSKRTTLIEDDAWWLESKNPKIDTIDKVLEENKLVCLSIRPFKLDTGEQKDRIVNWFVELDKKLIELGYTPIYIPISYISNNDEYQDNMFLKGKVSEKSIFLNDLCEVSSLRPENIKFLVSKCKLSIGLSYHFNVFSISQNIPTISLYYDEYYKIKNGGLLSFKGNLDNLLNPLVNDVDEVMWRIKKIFNI